MGRLHFDKGKVLVGAALVERMQGVVQEHDLVILVDRKENQIGALEADAGCIILCLGAKASKEVAELAKAKGAVIIETDLDTFSVSREINKSVPLRSFMTSDGIEGLSWTTIRTASKLRWELRGIERFRLPIAKVAT